MKSEDLKAAAENANDETNKDTKSQIQEVTDEQMNME